MTAQKMKERKKVRVNTHPAQAQSLSIFIWARLFFKRRFHILLEVRAQALTSAFCIDLFLLLRCLLLYFNVQRRVFFYFASTFTRFFCLFGFILQCVYFSNSVVRLIGVSSFALGLRSTSCLITVVRFEFYIYANFIGLCALHWTNHINTNTQHLIPATLCLLVSIAWPTIDEMIFFLFFFLFSLL